MSQIFVVGAERRSFDGAVVLMLDDGSSGTVYALPCETATFGATDSNSYPSLIDDNAIGVNKAVGVRVGMFEAAGFVKNDHFTAADGHDFLTQAFGPRTAGQLAPWILALIPYSGAAAVVATGLWFSKLSLMARIAGQGAASSWQFRLRGRAADPDNYYGAAAPSMPPYAGTLGTGIGTMAGSSFSNGAASGPVVYDAIRSVRLDLDNRLGIIPAMKSPQQRICAGFAPGQIGGEVSIAQLGGASTALPMATGDYPLDIAIPDGSGAKVLTIATSLSWDSAAQEAASRDFWSVDASYTLFGTNGGNATGTASTPWPFVVAYA